MTEKLIAAAWADIEKDQGGFCCERHRLYFQTIFYSGAMSVMGAVTGWRPEGARLLSIDCNAMVHIAVELTEHFAETEAKAAALESTEAVHH